MGLFDAIKAGVGQLKDAATSMAGDSAAELWAQHGGKVCDAVLSYASKTTSSGASYISDDAKYKTTVIDPAWDLMPLPIRMIGRDRLKWDSMFLAARANLFVVDGETVTLHPEARQRLEKLIVARLPGKAVEGSAESQPAVQDQ